MSLRGHQNNVAPSDCGFYISKSYLPKRTPSVEDNLSPNDPRKLLAKVTPKGNNSSSSRQASMHQAFYHSGNNNVTPNYTVMFGARVTLRGATGGIGGVSSTTLTVVLWALSPLTIRTHPCDPTAMTFEATTIFSDAKAVGSGNTLVHRYLSVTIHSLPMFIPSNQKRNSPPHLRITSVTEAHRTNSIVTVPSPNWVSITSSAFGSSNLIIRIRIRLKPAFVRSSQFPTSVLCETLWPLNPLTGRHRSSSPLDNAIKSRQQNVYCLAHGSNSNMPTTHTRSVGKSSSRVGIFACQKEIRSSAPVTHYQ